MKHLKGALWELKPKEWNANVAERLEGLPGCRIDSYDGRCVGMVDAVASASYRITGEIPNAIPTGHGYASLDAPSRQRLDAIGLRPYQLDGAAKTWGVMQLNGGALLADDVGLGKTAQAIAIGQLVPGRVLIVCPAYVRETWRQEIKKWVNLDAAVLAPGTTKKEKAEWLVAQTAKYVVTSYELVQKAKDVAFGGWAGPDLLIMDEAHYLCGRKTLRGKTLEEIAIVTPYKLAITATPMWSRPRDLYKLLCILFGKRFGSAGSFDLAYCGGTPNQYGGLENKGATRGQELRMRLSCYTTRREKSDVLTELPDLTRQILWVDPTPEAERAFLKAIGTGAQLGDSGVSQALQATLEGKVKTVVELAQNAGKFLLFTYMRSHASQIAKMLQDSGTPCVCITGAMVAADRQQACDLARRNGWGVVATIDSLGAGVNLQDVASYGIMHSIDWVPLKMVQAEGRLHRMGQKLPVHWVYVAMRDTMDSVVVSTVVDKLDQWRSVIGKTDSNELRNNLSDSLGDAASNAQVLSDIYATLGE